MDVPGEPTNLRKGNGVPGLLTTGYVQVAFSPPTGITYPPLERYVVTATATHGIGQTESTSINVSAAYDTESGVTFSSVGSQALAPGTTVTLRVQACNAYSSTNNGCSSGVEIDIETDSAAPGPIDTFEWCTAEKQQLGDLSPLCANNITTDTLSVLAIGQATYTGGLDVTYFVEITAYPGGTDIPTDPQPAQPNGVFTFARNIEDLYLFRAQARNSAGNGPWTEQQTLAGVPTDAPTAPGDLAVIEGTEGPRSFNVSWTMQPSTYSFNGSSLITIYTLSMFREGSVIAETVPITPEYSNCAGHLPASAYSALHTCGARISKDFIVPYTNYTLALTATNAAGRTSAQSNFDIVQTGQGKPSAPSGDFVVSNVSTSGFTVSFGAADPNGNPLLPYTLALSCDGGWSREDSVPHNDLEVVQSAYVGSVPQGSNCSITVTAHNDNGDSPSATFPGFYFTHDRPRAGIAPRASTESSIAGLETTRVLLVEWPQPFDFGVPIDYFSLTVDNVTHHLTHVKEITQYLYVNLIPGTSHFFSVSATNAIGTGESSPEVSIQTDSAVPATPPKPETQETTCGQSNCILVTIKEASYAGVPDATSLKYDLEVWAPSVPSSLVLYANRTAAELSVEVARVNTLNYNVRSRARNSVGPSEWSDAQLVENLQSGFPPNPRNVSVVDEGGRSLEVSWIIDRDRAANLTFAITARLGSISGDTDVTFPGIGLSHCPISIGEDTLCTYTITGLAPNTQYNIEVLAVNDAGSLSSQVDKRTLNASPDAPGSLDVSAADNSSITLTWTAPATNGYDLNGYALFVQSRDSDGPDELYLLSTTGTSMSRRNRRALAAAGTASSSDPAEACTTIRSSLSGAPTSTSTSLSFTLGSLAPGTSLIARLYACNQLNASSPACICSRESCTLDSSCDSNVTTPPQTHGVPQEPDPVLQDERPELAVERVRTLFLDWTSPYDNELDITATQLKVDDATEGALILDLPPSQTSYNLTGRAPAKVYSAQVRMLNSMGWSSWSQRAWLSTLPTVPDQPAAPYCDGSRTNASGATFSTSYDQLLVQLNAPENDNGQPVVCYEVAVVQSSDSPPDYAADQAACTLAAATRCAGVDSAMHSDARFYYFAPHSGPFFVLTNTSSGLAGPLYADTRFNVSARAINALGCSAWSPVSTTCETDPMPDTVVEPLNMLFIIIPLVAFIVCLIVSFCWYCRAQVQKIVAPKLRRRKQDDIVGDFVSSDMTPMEEHDPELVINPIMVHKMKRNKEQQRKKKMMKAKTGLAKSGGLARLNLVIEDNGPPQDPKKLEISQVDTYLEKERNIVDNAKNQSAYDRELAGRALQKGQKKAATMSKMNAELMKKNEGAAARMGARKAGQQLPQDDPDYEGAGPSTYSAGGRAPADKRGSYGVPRRGSKVSEFL